ncbi:MAG: hypothetical protein K2M10_06110 [Muribaculaceae bacterium]|nr:hypothetical protein [Muribaculaceae bacterium]MDE6299201.1 hypothetical protein [Muribaculaceae bacterium]
MEKDNKKVTYYAPGLLDWQMLLKVNQATVKIHFTGGYMSPNGPVSARFVTNQSGLIHLIENSQQFKQGRVKRWQ